MKMNIPERIKSLREAMSQHEINAYIIPSSDPHLSEYPADHWKSRAWISGFTGSAGTVALPGERRVFQKKILRFSLENRGSPVYFQEIMR